MAKIRMALKEYLRLYLVSKLTDLLKEKQISIDELVKKARLSQDELLDIQLSGSNLKLTTVYKLAKALDCIIVDLLPLNIETDIYNDKDKNKDIK